tara:strand:- start:1351 stop:1800 length:450 start_codon:yes stop_codon:yes gene_type:complete
MISKLKSISVYVMSFLYIFIGIKHFIDLDYFLKIMPPYMPFKKFLVLLSGFFEILFGTMIMFKKWRNIGSWAIILLLIAVFPANIYIYNSEEARLILNASKQDALIRMPFQMFLITIAYWHSIQKSSNIFSLFCLLLFFVTIIYFTIII